MYLGFSDDISFAAPLHINSELGLSCYVSYTSNNNNVVQRCSPLACNSGFCSCPVPKHHYVLITKEYMKRLRCVTCIGTVSCAKPGMSGKQ